MSKKFDFNIEVKDLNGGKGAPSPKYDRPQMSTISGISGVTGSAFGGPAGGDMDISPRNLRDMWKVPEGKAAKKMFADLDKNDHLDVNGDLIFETVVRK
jgi:hypothetical protein